MAWNFSRIERSDLMLVSNQTGNADIFIGEALFWGAVINTDGTNNGVLKVFNGNPGTTIFPLTCVGADISYGGMLPRAVYCDTSIRITLSGTGASAIIYYQLPY